MCYAIQYGRTALHYAVDYRHVAVVQYLVEKCLADLTSQNKNGRTPLNCAEDKMYWIIAHYLKAQLIVKIVFESNILPFYSGVRGIIVKYLQ